MLLCLEKCMQAIILQHVVTIHLLLGYALALHCSAAC